MPSFQAMQLVIDVDSYAEGSILLQGHKECDGCLGGVVQGEPPRVRIFYAMRKRQLLEESASVVLIPDEMHDAFGIMDYEIVREAEPGLIYEIEELQ